MQNSVEQMSNTDRLANVAVESLEQIKSWVEGTANPFMSEQAPLYVREVINWEIASHAIMIFVGILLGILAFVLYKIAGKFYIKCNTEKVKNYRGEMVKCEGLEFTYVMSYVFSGGISITSILITFTNIYWMIRPIVAPRVVILEHLQQLIN